MLITAFISIRPSPQNLSFPIVHSLTKVTLDRWKNKIIQSKIKAGKRKIVNSKNTLVRGNFDCIFLSFCSISHYLFFKVSGDVVKRIELDIRVYRRRIRSFLNLGTSEKWEQLIENTSILFDIAKQLSRWQTKHLTRTAQTLLQPEERILPDKHTHEY